MSKSRHLTITVSVPEAHAGTFLADLAEKGFDHVGYKLETLLPFHKNTPRSAESHIIAPAKTRKTRKIKGRRGGNGGEVTKRYETPTKGFVLSHIRRHPGGIGFNGLSKLAAEDGRNPNVGSYLGQLIHERLITKDSNKLYHAV